ncbi:MAG: phenylalanine--tRNA ligase subunit beta [Bdellovibrionia bacterium]
MRISWNWLSELVDLTELKGPADLAERLTRRGLEIESIESQAQGFEHVVTAQVLEKTQHPQADRLSVCQVSFGQAAPLEIVCGAQNFKAGDRVCLAQVGAHLPNGMKISAGKIRGVLSQGMLCSEEELGLQEKSEGILVLPADTPLGVPLAQWLGRDDTILTFKITPNRGDCLSHFGLAREVAAALGVRPKAVQAQLHPFTHGTISVQLEAQDACPQFFGLQIEGVTVGPSPSWVVKRLESLGSRSINNVVDATNLVMFELGHPMHAYDAEKLQGSQIRVRTAQAGEKLGLLDGSEIELLGSELVIADEAKALALAGVMGGSDSEVTLSTRRLFLECAEFHPSWVRKASSRHQRKTDAAYRFERGVDPQGLALALRRLTDLILELAGGQIKGGVQAFLPSRDPNRAVNRVIPLAPHFLNDLLGFERQESPLTPARIQEILTGLDCQIQIQDSLWSVTPPSYRLDLQIREDLAEEVARSIGYDAIASTLPALSSSPVFGASAAKEISGLNVAKNSLVCSGLHETVNFAFTSCEALARLGMKSSVVLKNPLSEEYEALVPSLIPGLLQNALQNWNHHFGSEPLAIRLFELRPTFEAKQAASSATTEAEKPGVGGVHAPSRMETSVAEAWKLSCVLAGPRYAEGLRAERGEVDFYDLKAIIDGLLTDLGSRGVRYQPLSASRVNEAHPLFSLSRLFHPGQSVEVLAGNQVAGYFGLLHPAKAKEFKCRAPLWMAELDWAAIRKLSRDPQAVPVFQPWPQFPSMERDFALLVKSEVTSEKLCQLAMKSGKPIAKVAKVFDIYRGAPVPEGMTSVAVRVTFYDETRSLQETETEEAARRIVESWKKELGVEQR